MTKDEFSDLLNKGNYTPEFRAFLEKATIKWIELIFQPLKCKIKGKWISDTELQPYFETKEKV